MNHKQTKFWIIKHKDRTFCTLQSTIHKTAQPPDMVYQQNTRLRLRVNENIKFKRKLLTYNHWRLDSNVNKYWMHLLQVAYYHMSILKVMQKSI